MGVDEYRPIAARHRVPIVITGFEPVDILQGVLMAVRQLEEGRFEVENAYARSVRADGNPSAREMIREVFRVVPREWRGLGEIPASGLGLAPDYAAHDAAHRFPPSSAAIEPTDNGCLSGLVLRGQLRPGDCPHFGTTCTPRTPLGATMVSSEGACAAYYQYRRVAPQVTAGGGGAGTGDE